MFLYNGEREYRFIDELIGYKLYLLVFCDVPLSSDYYFSAIIRDHRAYCSAELTENRISQLASVALSGVASNSLNENNY